MSEKSFQIVIIGSGLSGLMTAYELALKGQSSLVISKGPLIQTNTWWAQGGVAAAVSHTDSVESHVRDTLDAGGGLCVESAVKRIVDSGPALIGKLIESGMLFDKEGLDVSLGQEGGHKQRRILHVDDQTGRALHEFILNKLITDPKLSPFCDFLPNNLVQLAHKDNKTFKLKLLDVITRQITSLECSHLVLATGGAGKSFLYTSNWEGATGDGFKLAHDLGAKLKNLEMIQFHPTCLFHSAARNFLISEALRGEGAKLVDDTGHRFAFDFHKDGELAPRDIVSRAIEHNIKSRGKACVYLDITHHSEAYLQKRFPTIYKKCAALGYKLDEKPVPVVPAAHYTCGGISTKKDLVSTDVEGLFAVGECGYTGLHGANRLASNSLLECLATASFCAEAIKSSDSTVYSKLSDPIIQPEDMVEDLDPFLVNALWEEVRNLMWNYVGIQRSNQRLLYALEKISHTENLLKNWKVEQLDRDATELINIVFFSKACIQSALARKESRGCHFLEDHPETGSKLFTTQFYKGKVSTNSL
jgi:L-aspartate oxidase